MMFASKRIALTIAAVGAFCALTACEKKATTQGANSPAGAAASQDSGKEAFPEDAPVKDQPDPPPVSGNPLEGADLFVDPKSLAMLQYNRLAKTEPKKAEIIKKIAFQPQGLWMGEWNTDIFRAVEHFVSRAQAKNQVPIVIAYNIPLRDCGQYSKGGLSGVESYRRWIRNVSRGIGDDPAVVILEPDALGHFQECLSEKQKDERMFMLEDAVKVIRNNNPNAAVYLDAGHARWVPAEEMAERLEQAGVEHAHGFSLNTSNYVSTEENTEYGEKLSELTGGKHFVIDTSRNGAGPYEEAETEEESWCNPPGRKIGIPPTTDTGHPLIDGYLWLKRPGESDGECQGGPKAGVWWEEKALDLAR